MKKRIALMSAAILASLTGFAQVEIHANEGGQTVGNDISGTTVTIVVTPDAPVNKVYTVTNVSGSMQLTIERFRITEVAGWEDGLSWAPDPDPDFIGMCYAASGMPTNPWTTPNSLQIDNGGNAIFLPSIHPNGVAGCGHYRYIVLDGGTPIDSIDLEVCSTLGIDELQEHPGLTTYPNPANDYLSITTTGLDGTGDLRITDVLGKVVYSEETGSVKTIDVSNFKNGVYFVALLDRGSVIRTSRVVIRH